MKEEKLTPEQENFLAMRSDIMLFMKAVWNKTPQPIKPQFRGTPVEQWTAEMFGDKIEHPDGIEEWTWYDFDRDKHYTWQQTMILDAVNKYERVSVSSGRNIGKTSVESWIIPWCLFKEHNSKAVVTAPSKEQMFDILWTELKVWHERMKEHSPFVYKSFEWQGTYFRRVDKEGEQSPFFASAKTGRKENPEALAGCHADFVLLLADEATGCEDIIFKTADDGLSDPKYLFFMASNPRRPEGYFIRSITSSQWHHLQFNSMQSPMYKPEKARDIMEDEMQEFGLKFKSDAEKKNYFYEQSDRFRYEVLGLPPANKDTTADGYTKLLRDVNQIPKPEGRLFQGKVALGIDTAGEGKDTCDFVLRDNYMAYIVASEKLSDGKSTAQMALAIMEEYNIPAENVVVDGFGCGKDTIQEMALAGKKVKCPNVGETKGVAPEFLNLKMELYWKLRQFFFVGGQAIVDDKWAVSLRAMWFNRTNSGKKQMMTKQELRKRGIPSPNALEALMLTFMVDLSENNKEKTIRSVLKRREREKKERKEKSFANFA